MLKVLDTCAGGLGAMQPVGQLQVWKRADPTCGEGGREAGRVLQGPQLGPPTGRSPSAWEPPAEVDSATVPLYRWGHGEERDGGRGWASPEGCMAWPREGFRPLPAHQGEEGLLTASLVEERQQDF